MAAAQEKSGRLSQRTAARRKFQFHAAQGREALAGERCQVSRSGAVTVHGVAEDETCLLLHRTVMLGGAHSQARLHVVVEIADRYARHLPCFPSGVDTAETTA